MPVALPASAAPLGLIIKQLRAVTCSSSPDELVTNSVMEDRAAIRKEFDKSFGSRLDYRLWRSFYYTSGLKHLKGNRIHQDLSGVDSQLDTCEDVEAWGSLVVLYRLITDPTPKHTATASHTAALGKCALNRCSKLATLAKSNVGCEIVRLLAQTGFRELADADTAPSSDDARERLTQLLATLGRIDSNWLPGDPIHLRAIYEEERLLPFGVTIALGLLYRPIVSVANAVRELAFEKETLDEGCESLLWSLAGLTRTAWRLSRTYRIYSERKGVSLPDEDPVFGSIPQPDDEYSAIQQAAYDAQNAGDELLAATLAHLMLRIAPANKVGQKSADAWSKWIHQRGLEIDGRFCVKTFIEFDESSVELIKNQVNKFGLSVLRRVIGIKTSTTNDQTTVFALWKFNYSDEWEETRLPQCKVRGDDVTVYLPLDFLLVALEDGFSKIEIIDSRLPLRFAKGGKLRGIKPLSVYDATLSAIPANTPPGDSESRSEQPVIRWNPFWVRLDSERRTQSDWIRICEEETTSSYFLRESDGDDIRTCHPFTVLKIIAHGIGKQILNDAEVIEATFRILLKHSLISLAAKCVLRLPVEDRKSTLKFVQAVKNVQQTLPIGLDEDQHLEWRNAIKIRFAAQLEAHQWSEEAVLFIHEILLGRSLTMMRRKRGPDADLFARKFYDWVSERELRGLFTDEFVFLGKGPATINRENFGRFAKSYQNSSGGPALFVSIVSLDTDKISVLVTDGVKWIHECGFQIPGHRTKLEVLRASWRSWLTGSEHAVPWDREFSALVKLLHRIAVDMNASPRTILLAVEAEFAAIPWQDLVRQYWSHVKGEDFPIVGLIPSFSWTDFAFQRSQWPDYNLRWIQDSSEQSTSLGETEAEKKRNSEYNDLRFALRKTYNDREQRRWNHIVIVAGHGKEGDDGFPVIMLKRKMPDGRTKWPLDREDWFEFGDYFVIVAHVCFGGSMKPVFLGDMGGIPGLVLGLNTRLMCAPVAEIPVAAALVLHRHLCDSDLPLHFSERFRAAIAEDARVGLYNLYGFPGEFVEKPLR